MIRFAVKIILFIILFNTDFLYSQDTIAVNTLRIADKHIESGDYNLALSVLNDFLFKDPANIDVQEKKISVLLQTERDKDAYKNIEELIQMYPDSPEYYYLRAVLNFRKEKYVKAIEDFDKSLQFNMPKSYVYKVYLNRGMSHFFLQDFELAETDFNSVLGTEPKSGAAYHGLGMVKYEQREYDEAVKDFQKSLSFDEENAITHFNMAMSYFRLNEKNNACYHFNRSCALGNRNACKLMMMECAQKLNLPK